MNDDDRALLRLPPQSLDAERGVLGGILLLNEAIEDVSGILDADHFYSDGHQTIFATISDLYENKVHGIDAVTLAEELMRHDRFEEVGGAGYLAEILDAVPHASHVLYYARIVREKYQQRQIIYGISELQASLYSGMAPDEAVAELDSISRSVGSGLVGETTVHISQAVDEHEEYERRVEAGEIYVISTTIKPLDELHELYGMPGGWYAILAARTSIGKTALAVQMACDCGANEVPAVVFSLEMRQRRVAQRVIKSRESAVARKLPVYLNDKLRNIRHIILEIRRLVKQRGVRLVVIDYLQLVKPEDRRLDRHRQIAEISGALVELKNELDIVIIAVSQLNRGSEDREPKLNDLSEGGAIENDADSVLLLYRPRDRMDMKIICAKNRDGSIGKVDVEMKPVIGRIEAKDQFVETERMFT